MSELQELIIQFDSTLKKYNFINYKKLYDPLSSELLSIELNKLNIDDLNFKIMYQWKNGYDPDSNFGESCDIFDFGTLLSLEAINSCTANNNSITRLWDNYFIPLITDTTGQYILFNNRKQNRDYGKLFLYSVSILGINPISYFDSIFTMINTTIKAYEANILSYDPDENWLNMNVDDFKIIAKKHNPRSDYWKLN
jgi:hypothetical protein